jgi:hypothetical protein
VLDLALESVNCAITFVVFPCNQSSIEAELKQQEKANMATQYGKTDFGIISAMKESDTLYARAQSSNGAL